MPWGPLALEHWAKQNPNLGSAGVTMEVLPFSGLVTEQLKLFKGGLDQGRF